MTEKILQKRKWVFRTGVIFIVFWSIVIGVINFGFFYLFGIPLFGLLVGIIFVWITKENIKTKILLTIVPLPLILLTFFLMLEVSKAEPENFLIPKDLRGEIVVFYDEPCGQPPIYENGRRVYNISDSGVLITSFQKNQGHLDRKFYLIDESGNKTEIPLFHWQDFDAEQRNLNRFYPNSVTEFTKDSIGAFWSYGSETYGFSRNSVSYIISSFRYFEKPGKEHWLERKQFTKKAGELLRNCR